MHKYNIFRQRTVATLLIILLFPNANANSLKATKESQVNLDYNQTIHKPKNSTSAGLYLQYNIPDAQRNVISEISLTPDFFIRYSFPNSSWSIDMLYGHSSFAKASNVHSKGMIVFSEDNYELTVIKQLAASNNFAVYLKGGVNYTLRVQSNDNTFSNALSTDYLAQRGGIGSIVAVGIYNKYSIFNTTVPINIEYAVRNSIVTNSSYPSFTDQIIRFGLVYSISGIGDITLEDNNISNKPKDHLINEIKSTTLNKKSPKQEKSKKKAIKTNKGIEKIINEETKKQPVKENNNTGQQEENRLWDKFADIFTDDETDDNTDITELLEGEAGYDNFTIE